MHSHNTLFEYMRLVKKYSLLDQNTSNFKTILLQHFHFLVKNKVNIVEKIEYRGINEETTFAKNFV